MIIKHNISLINAKKLKIGTFSYGWPLMSEVLVNQKQCAFWLQIEIVILQCRKKLSKIIRNFSKLFQSYILFFTLCLCVSVHIHAVFLWRSEKTLSVAGSLFPPQVLGIEFRLLGLQSQVLLPTESSFWLLLLFLRLCLSM